MHQNRKEHGIPKRGASASGPKRNHVTKKSHDQKTSNARKSEMEDTSDLSLSQGSGAALGASLRTIDSRKVPSFAKQKRDGSGK